jgi:hypothetical protein
MADQNQSNNQQPIVYALGAIAVLLLAIVIFMVYNNMHASSASTDASATSAASSTAASIAAQMPPATSPATFDPKTATKLPAGMTPPVALKTYLQDIVDGKFTEAYSLLPLAQKQSYGSADAYGSQVKSYGITGFQVGKPTDSGTEIQIVSAQDTSAMNITYTWVYTKVGNDWYVKSRTMGGTVQ